MREKAAAAAGYGWNEMHAYGRWHTVYIAAATEVGAIGVGGEGLNRLGQERGKGVHFPSALLWEVRSSVLNFNSPFFSGSDGAYLYGEEELGEEGEEELDGLEVEVEDGLGGLLDVDEDARFLEVSQFVAQTIPLHFVCEATQEQEVVCMGKTVVGEGVRYRLGRTMVP